jgi:hypothetical protein
VIGPEFFSESTLNDTLWAMTVRPAVTMATPLFYSGVPDKAVQDLPDHKHNTPPYL